MARTLHPATPGVLLVLSAPSGAGKSTLARLLLERNPDAVVSISVTTRRPRGSEKDGVEYYFVDDRTFDEMIASGRFAEWAEVHGARYGTPRSEIEANLGAGKTIIFDIDVQGGEQLQAAYPDATTVLIAPPSLEILERRLRGRSTDSDEVIERRLGVAVAELRRGMRTYRYLVVNDDLETAYLRIESIVRAERCLVSRIDQQDWLARLE